MDWTALLAGGVIAAAAYAAPGLVCAFKDGRSDRCPDKAITPAE